MKKNISYWNAIFTHILTTCFTGFFLIMGVGLLISKVAVGLLSSDSALLGMLPFFVIALTAAAVALATWLSTRFMSRYEINGVDNFVNFSSIVFCTLILLQSNLITAAISTIVFYTITRKKFHKVAATPVPQA